MILKIRHLAEYMVVKFFYCLFYVMPANIASGVGGYIGKAIGPLLSVNKIARKNLKAVFPEKGEEEINGIITDMWENLGRVVGEFPHMTKIKGDLFDKVVFVDGEENVRNAAKNNRCTIFFSGHLSNWEMVPKTIFEKGCPAVNLVYRRSNNPHLDKLILDVRNHYQGESIPKGTIGARYLIRAIKAGKPIGMLVDQKQNDGIAVPFFGRKAMTASAIANMALKYDCDLVPIQVIRTGKCSFKAKVYQPLKIENTGDETKDILKIMTDINATLESWIREYPSQWFWVHNRWPKG